MVCGKPIIVVNNGVVDQKQMKRLRMTTEDLSEQLRQMNVFRLQDVAYAIVETNGKMSVMKKPEQEQATASMLGIVVPDNGIEAVIISDGVISDFSLSLCNLTRDWVDGVLEGQKTQLQDVFIMTANRSRQFNIIRREEANP